MKQSTLNSKRIPLVTSLLAVIVGIGAKLSLTSGELLPGLDGAYYWVQVRSVVNNFTLAFSDLPFIFWVQAAIAKLVGDIPLGVRISDAALPALSAIPIYLIARRFKSAYLPAIAILVVLLHPVQLYFFTGDFIKNEATIPAVFFIAWVLFNWESEPKKFSMIALAIALIVIALSHFGTLLLALMMLSVWVLVQLRKSSKKSWLQGIAVSGMVLVAVLASLALLVTSRFERLITFITSPTVVFSNPAINGIIHNYSSRTMSITIIIGQLASLLLGYVTWKSRASFKFADLSLVIAALVSTFVLSSPVIGMEWSDRLAALSFAPLSIAAIIIFGTVQIAWQKSAVAILASVTLLATISLSGTQMKYGFEDVALKDLKDLVAQVDIPNNSVIVARHGVQYLAAWEFESDVTLDTYYSTADLSSYDSVFYIQEIKAEGAGAPPPSGKGPSDKKGKGDVPIDSKKSEVVTGQTVYENASFAMIKVR
jgi:hypothetical protein